MTIDILTIFTEMFDYLNYSIIGRAQENNYLSINLIDIREYSLNKHNKVDDYPYGGGPGMVMTPQPLFSAFNNIDIRDTTRVIYMSPRGKKLNQQMVEEFSEAEHLVILCGRYEGVDQRVLNTFVTDEVSIGDYVLTGGELPAMALIDSVARLIPGVLGDNASFEDESFYNGLLEHDQYTRPFDYQGDKVPEVLISGNHKKIEEWKLNQSIDITLNQRPDLIEKIMKSNSVDDEIKKIISEKLNEKNI